MSDKRYEANIIRATAVEPANNLQSTSAPGVWSIDEVVELQKKNKWPTVGNVADDVTDVFSTFLYTGNSSSQAIQNNINLGTWATENTVLHLTGDSLNDSSPFSHTVTAVGNTSVNTSTKKYGTGSIYFDGSGDYLRTNSGRYILGTNDFTLEFWGYYDGSNTKGIFHLWDGSTKNNYSLGLYHNGSEYVFNFKNGVDGTPNGTITSTGGAIPSNTWHHVAIVRYDNTLKLYVNGTAVTSGTDVSDYNFVMSHLEIGTHWDSNYTFTGYIDDWRITNGSARYTGNFTPPNAALPLDTTANGEGGLVWIKRRDGSDGAGLFDTARGATKGVYPSSTSAQLTDANSLTSFNSNGFSLGTGYTNFAVNYNAQTYVGWTWRKAPKFFDVKTVTHTNGSDTVVSFSDLGIIGMVIAKKTTASEDWFVSHRYNNNKYLVLNSSAAEADVTGNYGISGTNFTLQQGLSSGTYVLYAFAHNNNNNNGGFGPDGDADIIKCGSYTGAGSTDVDVNLGFEPQWIMIKKSSASGDNWLILDSMRGTVTGGNDTRLFANLANGEASNDYLDFTSTGFRITGTSGDVASSGETYIYMAIRRGPLAAPTDATKVFDVTLNPTSPNVPSDTLVDTLLFKSTGSSQSWWVADRLRQGAGNLQTDTTAAESSSTYLDFRFDQMTGTRTVANSFGSNYVGYTWKRAPSYFDVTTWTGTGSARTVPHGLTVPPEMIWTKRRSDISNWMVYHSALGNTKALYLDSTTTPNTSANWWNNTSPTSSVFTVGSDSWVNYSGSTYIAYLFSTVAGVSKVGSFSHTNGGGDTNVDCGFSSGARFVLVKRYDSTGGNWVVLDSVRGIVSGNDPYLLLDSTNAEVTNSDVIDPLSSGFTVADGFLASGNYIFYAIA